MSFSGHNARWLMAAGVVLAAGIAYSNSFEGAFFLDDRHHLVDNQAIRDLGNLPRFFVDPGLSSSSGESRMYRPLVMSSFAINHALGGLEVGSYHAVNLLIHATTALLVFWLLLALLGQLYPDEERLAWPALAGALLFALHPIQTEAVDYINARSSLLLGLFIVAATLAYLRYRGARLGADPSGPRFGRWVLLTWLAGLLALGSKESAPILVPLLITVGVVLDGKAWRAGLRRDWPVHLPLLVLSVVYFLSLRFGIPSDPASLGGRTDPLRSVGSNLMTQTVAVAGYLRSLVWPDDLALYRHVPVIESAGEGVFLLSAILLLALAAGGLLAFRRAPGVTLGLVWAAGSLAPTSSIFALNMIAAERRLYLAMVGVALIFATALYLGERALRARGGGPGVLVARVGVAALLGLLLVLTLGQNQVWRSRLSLWENATASHPESCDAWMSYAEALAGEGRDEEAAAAAQNSLERCPERIGALSVLARLHHRQGKLALAEREFLKVLASDDPRFLSKGEMSLELAEVHEKQGRLAEAEAIYSPYLQKMAAPPVQALAGMGRIAAARGQPEQAIELLQRAAAAAPGSGRLRGDLAGALLGARRFGEAATIYRELLAGDPRNFGLLYNLGLALEKSGQLGEARQAFERALALQPDHFQALVHLAAILQANPAEHPKSLAIYRRLLGLCPDAGCRAQVQQRLDLLGGTLNAH